MYNVAFAYRRSAYIFYATVAVLLFMIHPAAVMPTAKYHIHRASRGRCDDDETFLVNSGGDVVGRLLVLNLPTKYPCHSIAHPHMCRSVAHPPLFWSSMHSAHTTPPTYTGEGRGGGLELLWAIAIMTTAQNDRGFFGFSFSPLPQRNCSRESSAV